jgi:hypothetical protein
LETYEFDEHQTEAPSKKARPVWLMPLIGLLVLLAVAGAGFYGGISYQKGKQSSTNTPSNPGQVDQQFSQGQQGGTYGPMGAGGAMGTVTAISSSSISLKDMRSSTSTTYSITSSTTITDNGQSASTSDIAVGDSVVVIPSTSNTSQAAQIMINMSPPSTPGGYGQSPSTSS